MKKAVKKVAGIVLVALLSFSYASAQKVNKAIKTDKSKVVWKGYKVTGSHEGTINIESGSLSFDGTKLKGGNFVIDMTSINSTDMQGEYKDKLDGHLKSDDFFGVEKFPKAKLVLTSVKASGKNAYNAKGNLTIKGKTHPANISISIYGSKATATLKVDRSKYDVRFGSASFFNDLKDKTIYDEFDIVADLEF